MMRRGIIGLDQKRESIRFIIKLNQISNKLRQYFYHTVCRLLRSIQATSFYLYSYKVCRILSESNKKMSNPFFCFKTLEQGCKQMVELMKECGKEIYEGDQELVLPSVNPGFIRNGLPEDPPQDSHSIQHLIEMTRKVIFPGVMKWQSPKFFGYYPSSVNVTSVLGDMFAVITHTPAFNYATSPSHTELENLVVDWSAKALGLPEKFLIKNSGGGIINNSASESIFNTVHTAKFAKMKELGLRGDNPDVLKLVGYYGEGSHISSERALSLKDIYHKRAVPYIYNHQKLSYELDVNRFQTMVTEDIQKGLIPFWFGFSYGNTFCAAIDISKHAIQICKKHKIWIQVDAAFLGSTWISEKYKPSKEILQDCDSIDINLTKLLLNGTGGSLLYVADKKIVTQSFGASTINFPFYKNAYTGQQDVIDYKDWIFGLARRNNALKVYYCFTHYGLKTLRGAIEGQQEKFDYFISLVKQHPNFFKLHTVSYGLFTFHVLAEDGSVSNAITKQVTSRISNIKQGFSTPGHFKDIDVVRVSIGHFHTTKEHIRSYFNAIVVAAKEVRQGK